MNKRFFSNRVPVFGTVAMLVLCIVCFLLPFALRGARMAMTDMQNDVSDWLPSDFPETVDLAEFRRHFVGDQFVMVTGPWCYEGNGAYEKLLREIRSESLEHDKVLKSLGNEEELRAHAKGNELGLLPTGGYYHEDWGEHNEKWLLGRDGQWYWINRSGQLFKWDGQNNIVEGAKRAVERSVNGRNKAIGKNIATFGPPPDDINDDPNPFYADPERICARPFKDVSTGPEILQKMAGPGGTLRIGNSGDSAGDAEDTDEAFAARLEANKRLTGSLFGPTPARSFSWTFESLLQHVDKERLKKLQSKPFYKEQFQAFIQEVVATRFDGNFAGLTSTTQDDKLEIWYDMWFQLGLEAPARQTCLIVTLNEPIINELSRAVGRPVFFKPRGRILELATGKCGIKAENVHIGGPPADNVAIDEEGTNTLLRLVGLSLMIGVVLSYASFRSIRVTVMLFFVGGVAAIASLSYVWYAGSRMDAIVMSMPSLVYVLGLSGAVHIVNYYRDACYEDGKEGAIETAVRNGWFPCTLAAFTTFLGLISLCTSTLTPINKFGFFSAIAVLATVFLLFTYLPAALTIWPAGYDKRDPEEAKVDRSVAAAVGKFWEGVCEFVLRHSSAVAVTCVLAMCLFAFGVTKIKTTVHLLKLFDSNAKILQDYRWIEDKLGKLVPAEIVVYFDESAQLEVCEELDREAARLKAVASGETFDDSNYVRDPLKYDLKYTMLERIELSRRIRNQLEKFFGPDGIDIVGAGMSTDVFVPLQRVDSQITYPNRLQDPRRFFNGQLENKKADMMREQYLARVDEGMAQGNDVVGTEMWRISIRLAALNDVDYGEFINELKAVVEPVLTAYRIRTEIIRNVHTLRGEQALTSGKILVLGRNPESSSAVVPVADLESGSFSGSIDHTYVFADTLQDLLENRSFAPRRHPDPPSKDKYYEWVDPAVFNESTPFPPQEQWLKLVETVDCVVLIEDNPLFDVEAIKANAQSFVDCRNHGFRVSGPDPSLTARAMNQAGANNEVTAIYTGIVPIVYKAQNQLLVSLIKSIGLAFCMISVVMMLLLRDWKSDFSIFNMFNFRAGLISMLPNLFPILLVFGVMGLLRRKVDIGSMMTASVAMGIAVDDTIHFLNWYRKGLAEGRKRIDAIRNAYKRVATAMTQTTLIGGLGLSAFALSTFTPTQRFGVMMLFLLAAALIGDLILLPALLASPLGKLFGKEQPDAGSLDNVSTSSGGSDAGETSDAHDSALRVVHDVTPTDTDVHPDSLKYQRDNPGKAAGGD